MNRAAAACRLLLAARPCRRRLRPRRSNEAIRADMPQLMTLYRDLHANPELSMQEMRSPAKLAAETRKLGFTVTEKVGETGVVAVLRNGAGPGADAARRHGRPAGRGADRPALRLQGPRGARCRGRDRRHARLRPRHPYDRLGRHRPAAGGDEGPMVGDAGDDRPARRGDRRGRQGDARGRALHPLPQAHRRASPSTMRRRCRPA